MKGDGLIEMIQWTLTSGGVSNKEGGILSPYYIV